MTKSLEQIQLAHEGAGTGGLKILDGSLEEVVGYRGLGVEDAVVHRRPVWSGQVVDEPGFRGSLAENDAKRGTAEVRKGRSGEGTVETALREEFGVV